MNAASVGSAGVRPPRHRLFVERLLIAIAALAALSLLWWMRDLVMLVFGAIVIAVLLSVVGEPISKAIGLGRRAGLVAAIGVIIVSIGLLAYFFGSRIEAQFGQVADNLPQGWQDLRRGVADFPGGRQLLAGLDAAQGTGMAVLTRVGKLLILVGSGLLDLILILVGGVFFAAQPLQYRDGFLKLLPPYWRPSVQDALDDSGRALRLWLRGQLLSILLVGSLTWLGLALAGVPAAFALGTIAACLEVVPYIGPIVSAIPGLLLAVAVAPETALWALFVYVGVQQIEGNLIQPLVQRRVVMLPPAVTLFGMVAAGLLFGFLGVVFAAPAAVVAYVLLKRLYVREILHTSTSVPGEQA